jgi:hypothetical protein
MRSDIFAAGLWFFGVAGREMVGACLGYEYPGGDGSANWVLRRPGGRESRERRCSGEFRQRGLDQVDWTVECLNRGIHRFCRKVGMKYMRQQDK